jgi:hypothetical protein
MSDSQIAGKPVFLVVYLVEETPYACAFSTPALAEAFAAEVDGQVIRTAVDVHVDMIRGFGKQPQAC